MNCQEKAIKARLEADLGRKVRLVRMIREGDRMRVSIELAEPAQLRADHGGVVRRGVLHLQVDPVNG